MPSRPTRYLRAVLAGVVSVSLVTGTGAHAASTGVYWSQAASSNSAVSGPWPRVTTPGQMIEVPPRIAGPLRANAVFTVTTTADSVVAIPGSLRAAINSANGSAGLDMIAFNIPGGGVQTIAPKSQLPNITGSVIIDGTTQPGYAGTPLIELSGASAGVSVNGLVILGGSSTVRGLAISRFQSNGTGGNGFAIVLDQLGNNVIEGNFIGTDPTGLVAVGNGGPGIGIFGGSGVNRIGGTTAAQRNVIGAMAQSAIQVSTGSLGRNLIQGNYFGINAAGNVAIPNTLNGVFLDAPDDTVGGTAAGARNVMSGNPFSAILVGSGGARSIIIGNYIGTDAGGTVAIPNPAGSANNKGILINTGASCRIGGLTAAERNVIAGNLVFGVELRTTTGTKVQGNYIGVNALGNPLGNGSHGVVTSINAAQDTIGGITAAAGNVIANNGGAGVYDSTGTNNLIRFNRIFDNQGLGIDNFPLGITKNDSLDGDTGANDLQNFPILDSLTTSLDSILVYGRLDSKPGRGYRIDFYFNDSYDPSHFGEGHDVGFSTTVTTDPSGTGRFVGKLRPVTVPPYYVTATATDTVTGATSEFSQALCTRDQDGDGIMDCWESQNWGIDINSDGKIDLDLYARGARPDHKDVFVEIDAMNGFAPPLSAPAMVAQSFAAVPNLYVNNPDGQPGVALHYTVSDTTIPVMNFTTYPVVFTQIDSIKKIWFGTQAERADSNSRYILPAKRLVYRYGLWGRVPGNGQDSSWSGIAELTDGAGGDDFTVTFGSTGANGWGSTKDPRDHAGTFMHEMGHTLGLHHGGGDDVQYKPNYYSVMNYLWQTPSDGWQTPGSWRLDYARAAIPDLNESALNEPLGLSPPAGVYPIVMVPFTDSIQVAYTAPGDSVYPVSLARLEPGRAADWNGDGLKTAPAAKADLNLAGETPPYVNPGERLTGHNDWSNLQYNFRRSSSFKTTAPRAADETQVFPDGELTRPIHDRLNALPPPVPTGHFVMDGQLDGSATLRATNGALHLYAAYQDGQLYVATEGAPAQNADMFVFVTVSPGALTAVPFGKSGQVGAFNACLFNESTDNSSSWTNSNAEGLSMITTKASGTVFEGVIDIGLLYGYNPPVIDIAVGKYATSAGGALLAQVPAGNGDGNIDAPEFYVLGVPTGVGELHRPMVGLLELSAPRPNPVTTGARMELTLAQAADIQATVRDVAGRTVARLAKGRFTAGVHELIWTPGRRTAAGVYFVVVEGLGETHSTRVVLVK